MGAQASRPHADGGAASDAESAASREEVVLLDAPVREERVELLSVVESASVTARAPLVPAGESAQLHGREPPSVRVRPSSVPTKPAASAPEPPSTRESSAVAAPAPPSVSSLPPTAPQKPTTVVDRVVEIKGTVKHAYPLEKPTKETATDESQELVSDFSIGTGPCSRDADRVVAWEVEVHDSYQTCYVFFYNRWADAVSLFQRHYKVHIRGPGLVVIDGWDVGHDTEDVKRCYVVAEALVLKRTSDHSPRLLPKPQGVTIEIAYEEPRSIPDSDQLKYQPERTIHARHLYRENAEVDNAHVETIAKFGQRPANPRGKRTLRAMDGSTSTSPKNAAASAYMYTQLSHVTPGYANVYGVVVNLSLPKRSNGYDFYMSLYLVDETKPKREDALQVMVFLPTIEQMPRVLHVGDVVRFHKIRINRYQDKLQGVCNSRATRYLVLRRSELGSGGIEQLTNSATWTFDKHDEVRFHELTRWSERALHGDTSLPPGCPQAPLLLERIQFAESFADVVVRVLHVQEPYGDFTAARMVVWDGSGYSSSCQDLYAKLHRERQSHPDAVPFVPANGLLMEVVVDSCWLVLDSMGFLSKLTAHWCRFRNLAVSCEQGEDPVVKEWFELHFREVSSLMLVPEATPDVGGRLKNISEDSMNGAVPPRSKIADVELSDLTQPHANDISQHVDTHVATFIMERVPVTTLKAVLESTKIPRKYHCYARVVHVWPTEIERLVKRKSPADDDFIYSFVIRMEDSTGELDVIVHGDDAETFLQGVPPCDLTRCTSSRAILQKRVNALRALKDPVHFCVKSYTPKVIRSDGTIDERVRFRLFNTVLKVI